MNNELALHKYVIAADATGVEHALVFSRKLQHREAVPKGLTAVSAGFLIVQKHDVMVLENFGSTTLHLEPRATDKEALRKFFGKGAE